MHLERKKYPKNAKKCSLCSFRALVAGLALISEPQNCHHRLQHQKRVQTEGSPNCYHEKEHFLDHLNVILPKLVKKLDVSTFMLN